MVFFLIQIPAGARWRWCGASAGCAALVIAAGCGADSGVGSSLPASEGPPFGRGAADIASDGGSSEGGAARADGGAGGGGGHPLQLRWVHGFINLGPLRLCFDPDYQVDDPRTHGDEWDPGPRPAVALAPSAYSFGETTSYLDAASMGTGALTLHETAAPSAQDAGPTDPYYADAGAADGGMPDADLDAAPLPPDDAGSDAGASDPDPCSADSVRAVLPLPLPSWWLGPEETSPEELGLLASLDAAARVTLYGSGLALSQEAMDERRRLAEASHLEDDPDDADGAKRAGNIAVAELVARLGPRLLPAATGEGADLGFTLSLAHLVPDVPGSDGAPGAVRLCVTAGAMEGSAVPERSQAGLAFRARSTLLAGLEPQHEYSFRVFAQRDFDEEGKDCATTSRAPIAELNVPGGSFTPRRSYTLVLLGALSPDRLCLPPEGGEAALSDSCAGSYELLKPRLVLLED